MSVLLSDRTAHSLELAAKLFRGFADPSRLSLLDALRNGENTVSQLVEATGLSQPNTSSHLACLRECGLVESRQEGWFVYYSIADERTVRLLEDAEAILQVVADRIYTCTRYSGRQVGVESSQRGGVDSAAAMPGDGTRE